MDPSPIHPFRVAPLSGPMVHGMPHTIMLGCSAQPWHRQPHFSSNLSIEIRSLLVFRLMMIIIISQESYRLDPSPVQPFHVNHQQ